jgi:hypothetical protein
MENSLSGRGPSASGSLSLPRLRAALLYPFPYSLSLTLYFVKTVFCDCCRFDFERELSEGLCGDKQRCLPLGIKILQAIYSNITHFRVFHKLLYDLFLDRFFIKLFGGICYGCHNKLTVKIWFHFRGYLVLILRLHVWSILGIQNCPWSITDRPPV